LIDNFEIKKENLENINKKRRIINVKIKKYKKISKL